MLDRLVSFLLMIFLIACGIFSAIVCAIVTKDFEDSLKWDFREGKDNDRRDY